MVKPGSKKDGAFITVDTSELYGLIEKMRAIHTKREFELLMARAFRRTAPRVRTILRREVPHDYQARPAWIGKQVGNANTTIGQSVTCTIPVEGARGRIGGGGVYSAKADAGGASIRTAYSGRAGKRTRRSYKIRAQVVTGGSSALPSGSGSEPVHFMVFSGPHKGKVYARLDKSGDHIRPATGIGVPQMPTNRSREAVQDGIIEVLKQRIEHEHQVLMQGLAR